MATSSWAPEPSRLTIHRPDPSVNATRAPSGDHPPLLRTLMGALVEAGLDAIVRAPVPGTKTFSALEGPGQLGLVGLPLGHASPPNRSATARRPPSGDQVGPASKEPCASRPSTLRLPDPSAWAIHTSSPDSCPARYATRLPSGAHAGFASSVTAV